VLSIILALAFGAIWLFGGYRPNFVRRPGMLLILIVSAFLTLAAISFVQIPLQSLRASDSGDIQLRNNQNLALVMAIPQIALSGLVQEGAKLLPVVVYRCGEG